MKHRVRLALFGVAATAAATAALFAIAPSNAQQEPDVDLCELIAQETEGEEFCGLDIDKDRTSAASVNVGGSVTFLLEVTNTGTIPLTNVGVIDQYDDELSFDSSNPVPSIPADSGLAIWDGLDPNVLDPGESTTITVTLEALEATSVAENCAMAFADIAVEEEVPANLQALQEGTSDIEADFDCAEVQITSGGSSGGGAPKATLTNEPTTPSPTAIVTVAPATVVPQPTQPAGIVAPDTGDGPGSGGNGSLWIIAALLGSAGLAAGAGLRLVARRSR